MTTACRNCRHLRNINANPAAPNIWYSLLCTATPLPQRFDPYSGKVRHDGQEFAFCRDVNNGNCPKFEARADFMAQFK
jgi:hypothetical protein